VTEPSKGLSEKIVDEIRNQKSQSGLTQFQQIAAVVGILIGVVAIIKLPQIKAFVSNLRGAKP